MKTAVSIPNDVFADAERLAEKMNKSRSQLYTHALREYVARHADERVTDALDRLWSELGAESEDEFATAMGRRRLRRTEW